MWSSADELGVAVGLAALRVRGQPRVTLAVYLKALACNVKRMVCACMPEADNPGPIMA